MAARPQDVAGRGLMIVATLAQRWVVHDGSSRVWFELQRSGGGKRPSPPHLSVEQRPEPLD